MIMFIFKLNILKYPVSNSKQYFVYIFLCAVKFPVICAVKDFCAKIHILSTSVKSCSITGNLFALISYGSQITILRISQNMFQTLWI